MQAIERKEECIINCIQTPEYNYEELRKQIMCLHIRIGYLTDLLQGKNIDRKEMMARLNSICPPSDKWEPTFWRTATGDEELDKIYQYEYSSRRLKQIIKYDSHLLDYFILKLHLDYYQKKEGDHGPAQRQRLLRSLKDEEEIGKPLPEAHGAP